jgi:molybdopterin converting factor subunit 1
MQVRVLLFARARDLAGRDVLHLELPEGATLAELRQTIARAYPQMSALLVHSGLAVNHEWGDPATVLTPGAEVAWLPPVSGG